MDRSTKVYPNISDLLAIKAEGRRIRAQASFADKIVWVENARRDLLRIDRFRQSRMRAEEKASDVPPRQA